MNIPSAFTVDLEDGVNIAMRDHFQVEMPPTNRVITNTERLLDLFSKHDVKATFFTLGQVAHHHPSLIKKIHSQGHELAVHGYDHLQFFRLTPSEAKNDIVKAKDTIEDIIGASVSGFRAPAFSILPSTSWALELLAESGFKYDSSIVPVNIGRYGWSGFPQTIQKLRLSNGLSLIEVPLSVVNLFGKLVPACGGGYLRLFPYWFTRWALKSIRKERPGLVYMHPYEIDVNPYPSFFNEALANASLRKKFSLKSMRINRATVYSKLDHLMSDFKFTRLDTVIQEFKEHNDIPEFELTIDKHISK